MKYCKYYIYLVISNCILVFAYGLYGYISDGFNVFDGVIVILSSFEIYSGLFYGIGAEGSGLSVLRTFRLLRILKLVRFLPNLRRQLVVMLRTMDNVAVFFGLLMLFIFIFRYNSRGASTKMILLFIICYKECMLYKQRQAPL